MRTIRLLATSLLVAVCAGLSSCGGDDFDSAPMETLPSEPSILEKMDKAFTEYIGDYSNITCRYYQELESSILFAGLKNQRLWFAEYEKTEAKRIKLEWTDIEKTDTIQQLYKGYGEYETLYVKYVAPLYYKETSTGNIVTFNIGGKFQTIFTSNHKAKRTQLQYDNSKNGIAYNWYKESVFIADCCYSHEGDTIYIAKSRPSFDENGNPAGVTLVSYEEGIELGNSFIRRLSIKEGKSVWGTSIVPPFDVPSDAKRNYTLLDNATNIWEYKCEVTFYDGTKRDFTFKINIENGTIIANVTGITLNEVEKELDINETFQLVATIMPDNANNKNVTWSSSDESVANVNKNGLVTAKTIGTTTITVTTEDGSFTTSCAITVKMKQDISAYIETKVVPDGYNAMGQFLGIFNCTITNNSTEPISLIKIVIVNGDGKTIFGKHYDNQTISPKQSYLEGVQGLPAIYEPTVTWTYAYNGIEYTTSKTYKK